MALIRLLIFFFLQAEDDIRDLVRSRGLGDVYKRQDLPYPLKSYRRKEDDRDYSVKLEAGLRHGLRLQSGINPGHHLSPVSYTHLTLPTSDLV